MNKTIGNIDIPNAVITNDVSMGYVLNNSTTLSGSLSAPTDTLYASQTISMESVVNSSGGGLSNSLAITDVNQDAAFTLGSVATSAGGTFETGINAANGTNNFFPSFSESNAGTYGGGNLGNFTSASISGGTMTIEMTNNWPVVLSMDLDLVNTTTGATIQSFTFTNVAANGGIQSDTKSLVGKTLPNTIGMKVVSISSPGSFPATVPINVNDSVALNISTNNLETSSYNAPFPSVSETNVGTYGAGVAGFSSATFSGGSLSIAFTNDWPIPMSMGIDLVDTTDGSTILSYAFNNVAANGGNSTVLRSLANVTLPAELGIKITSITSPGSLGSSVNIDLQDALTLEIIGSNMSLSQFTAPFPAFSQSDVFSQSLSGSGFESATFSDGTMEIAVQNGWPIDLSFDFEVYDTVSGNSILTYSINNVAASGGTASQFRFLGGKTFPNTAALKFSNVSSSGSSTDVLVDITDELAITVTLDSVKISAAVAEIPSVNIDSLSITQFVDLDTLEINEIQFNTCHWHITPTDHGQITRS